MYSNTLIVHLASQYRQDLATTFTKRGVQNAQIQRAIDIALRRWSLLIVSVARV